MKYLCMYQLFPRCYIRTLNFHTHIFSLLAINYIFTVFPVRISFVRVYVRGRANKSIQKIHLAGRNLGCLTLFEQFHRQRFDWAGSLGSRAAQGWPERIECRPTACLKSSFLSRASIFSSPPGSQPHACTGWLSRSPHKKEKPFVFSFHLAKVVSTVREETLGKNIVYVNFTFNKKPVCNLVSWLWYWTLDPALTPSVGTPFKTTSEKKSLGVAWYVCGRDEGCLLHHPGRTTTG